MRRCAICSGMKQHRVGKTDSHISPTSRSNYRIATYLISKELLSSLPKISHSINSMRVPGKCGARSKTSWKRTAAGEISRLTASCKYPSLQRLLTAPPTTCLGNNSQDDMNPDTITSGSASHGCPPLLFSLPLAPPSAIPV